MSEPAPLGLLVLSGVRHAASYLPVFGAHPDVELRALCEEGRAPDWAHRDTRLLAEQYRVPFVTDPEGDPEEKVVIAAQGCPTQAISVWRDGAQLA